MNRQQKRFWASKKGKELQAKILRQELKKEKEKMQQNPEQYRQDIIDLLNKHKIDLENGKKD